MLVRGPTLLIFTRAVSQAEIDQDDAIRSAMAHVEFALSDLTACFGRRGVTLRLLQADAVVLDDGRQPVQLKLTDDRAESGCVLARPGRAPERVGAEMGPSSLSGVCAEAATRYFGVPGCD